ncbi:MAG: carboxypeptidase-like regulatory domain-containing protein [Thermoguttaceae bacterium]|nr:carboxypeptidase-like regulatory domain-containing protein [Thermoguttaceae bacterium]
MSGGGSYKNQRGNVSGTVKLDNKPLTNNTTVAVSFFDDLTGRSNGCFIEPDGTYRVNKLGVGPYLVTVAANIAPPSGPESPTPKPSPIPRKYCDYVQSGLTYTVQEGENRFDIELKSK